MDPNLILLYECIQTVGAKKIDFSKVGAALGVNGAAARMRYSRLEAKLKAGRSAKSRIKTDVAQPVKPRVPKPTTRVLRIAKKQKRASSESESAVSSDDEESEEDYKVNNAVTASNRRTRGVKLNFEYALGSDHEHGSSADGSSSIDEYKGPTEEESEEDTEISDIGEATPLRKKAKLVVNAARSRRSGAPDITPRRITKTTLFGISPLTPPGSSASTRLNNTESATVTSPSNRLDYDDQVKQDLSGFRVGMLLPLSVPSSKYIATVAHGDSKSRSLSVGPRARAVGSPNQQLETNIMESIERDHQEDAEDVELEDDRDDYAEREEEVSLDTSEIVMEPPTTPSAKKTKAYNGGCVTQ